MVAPAVALLAVVAWNVSRWRAVSDQEQQNRSLGQRVESARSSKAKVSQSAEKKGAGKALNAYDSGPLDWAKVSKRLAELEDGSGLGGMREMMSLQKRVASMTPRELLAALEEIGSLGLEDEAKASLEEMLIEPLIENDPEAALRTFEGRIRDEDDAIGWLLPEAFGNWLKKDPTAATAWFESQIAAGTFESKSLDGVCQARLEFEAALVGQLLDSGGVDAAQRIAALPEDQRREALEQIPFAELSPAGQKAYTEMVRQLVPQDERDGSFTHVISELIPEGGYERVEAFLNEVGATPEERVVSAREAANSALEEIASDRAVTREDVDAMRRWLDRQAPGTADKVTGEALADAAQDGGEFGFEEASKLALEYHQRSSNDDVLVAFLESFAARSNLEEALPLVDKIKDPQRREEILKELK